MLTKPSQTIEVCWWRFETNLNQ